MPTITAQQIADRAWTKVNEATGGDAVRWTAAEALNWVNDAQREVVNQLPKANPVRAVVAAVAGTRQDLATLALFTGIQVLDVVRNFAANGTTPGRAITRRERAWLDDHLPDWHAESASRAIHWTFDERDPKAFYLYPAIIGGGKVELIYAAAPASLASLAQTIALDDIYANAIQYFVLFSFYSKDSTYTNTAQMAASYWALFQGCLGVRATSIATADQAGAKQAAGAA